MRPAAMFSVLLCLLCGLWQVGCASAPSPASPTTVAAPATPTSAPAAPNGSCLGNRVPPAQYLQQTAFVPSTAPNALENASQQAQEALTQRLCQGYRCSEIAPHVTVWHTAVDGPQACAMAVVKASAVEAFQEGPREALEQDLADRAREIAGFLAEAGHPKARVALDNVRDLGVDGGPRAEWLLDRMSAALSKTPVTLVRLPREWTGLGVPRGVEGVLRARVTRVHGREALLEVAWTVEMHEGLKSAGLMRFPELIGPLVAPASEGPELAGTGARVALRFEARPGGALCEGQRTRLRLAVAEPLHVRVLNLFGEEEAVLLWASPGAMPASGEEDLGEFVALAAPDERPELFWVVGAPTADQLGRLHNAPAPCRLPREFARLAHAQKAVAPDLTPFSASRSFRVMRGGECGPPSAASPAPSAPDHVQGPEALPWCW